MTPVKQRSIESFIAGVLVLTAHLWLISIPVHSNAEAFALLAVTVSLACFYLIGKDLRFLISMSSDFQELKTKFDTVMFLLCLVVMFNGFMAAVDFHQLNFPKTLFILLCLFPIYLFFAFLCFHLLILHKKKKLPAVNLFFAMLFMFALLSASLIMSGLANVLLSVSYIALSIVLYTYST
ncbi:hypothetical protein [Bacillus sp. FJAT-27251]|uniref:hypothetical protein n=1 Tax=Bacillus sp. FJAT-27251 TaxID=1684142 RepID=UPI0006A76301|nr:hypothetical protein [Bacillus sp. FJAT-27251]